MTESFVFDEDFANNWTKGQQLECEIHTDGTTLVDGVACIDTEELLKHGHWLNKRYVTCVHCNKRVYENSTAIRRTGFTGFFCSYRCYAMEHSGYLAEVTDELVSEDKEASGYGWNIDKEDKHE